ncbi:MAG: hypothetical protein K0R98_159 [Rickettsiaceae bacterium]|jgi:hypothetical protein|nr:hypothetical protein [Rickettsiaceae bacterium]
MLTHNTNKNKSSLDSLYSQLGYLQKEYGKYLEEQKIKKDVDCLRGWITYHKNGKIYCGEWLNEYGHEIITDIQLKLRLAFEEQQHVDDEFPNNNCYKNGFKCDELGKAIKIASKASRKLGLALNELQSPIQ